MPRTKHIKQKTELKKLAWSYDGLVDDLQKVMSRLVGLRADMYSDDPQEAFWRRGIRDLEGTCCCIVFCLEEVQI
jgi:hypothetical protein